MALRVPGEKWAAVTYLVPAATVGGIWWILLTVGNTPKSGPSDMLRYLLFEAPEAPLFWWLVVLPTICLLLSGAYFSSVAQGKTGAIALCSVGFVLAVAAWLLSDWTIALFVTLPLLFSVPTVKCHLTTSRPGT